MGLLHRGAYQAKRLLFAGVAAATVLAASAAAAQGQHPVRIAAGPLDAALVALANQTHEQLLYTSDLVAGRKAPAVTGNLTAEQALARLLEHLDISVTRAGPEVLVLRSRTAVTPARAARPPAGVQAPEVVERRPFVAESAGRPLEVGPPAAIPLVGEQPANTVEAVEVTGTHIHGGVSASPQVHLDRETIERRGFATVAEAVETLPQNFSGVATEGSAITGADKVGRNPSFSSSVNLRGLGPDATLILINGRRMAGAGAFGDFNDISTVPTVALERLDVLLDGASALYGSDAVGGVVNILLRKDFDGAETRLFQGAAPRGEPVQIQVGQIVGRQWSSGGAVLAYEFQHRSALSGDDRPFSNNADLRPLGGSDQRLSFAFPGNTGGFAIPAGQNGSGLTPGQFQRGVINRTNQRSGEDLLPDQKVQSVYATAHQWLGERLELSTDLRYGYRTFSADASAPISLLTVTRANPFFVSPVGGATDSILYSFVGQLPNSVTAGHTEAIEGVVDARVRLFRDWQADGYLAYARQTEQSKTSGLVNSTALNETLGTLPDNPATPFSTATSGFFNPFAGILGVNSPSMLGFISEGFLQGHTRDVILSANLQADGTLFHLPGGAVKLAVGGQLRREHLTRTGVNFFSTLTPAAQTLTDETRNVAAGYVELQAPLVSEANARPGLRRLDVTLAERVEHYDDVGSTSNPQVGLRWSPFADLTVRGTYGTSFRAPALREVHDPAVNTPVFFTVGTDRILGLALTGGNPDLRPETAKTWTLGADFTPAQAPGLRLSASWFDVTFRNRIDRPVLNNQANALTDPALASFVSRISPTTNAADLAAITALLNSPATTTAQGVFPPEAFGAIVQTRYVNTTSLHVQGIDLEGAYRVPLGSDVVALAGSASYLLHYNQQITPTSIRVEDVGIANFPVRFRARATADWTHDRITLGAAINYISAYRDSLGVKIGDQPTVDLQARLAARSDGLLRGVAATLNVRNVFDRVPPFYNNTAGVGYDPANADPIGRFVSIQLTRSW
jgi:iron complex outermembrane receptor protein